jgi:hypothetical protein
VEWNNSPIFCWSTNKGSFNTDMYVCIFHLFSVWYSFFSAFPLKPLADRRGPQLEKHCIVVWTGHTAYCIYCMY